MEMKPNGLTVARDSFHLSRRRLLTLAAGAAALTALVGCAGPGVGPASPTPAPAPRAPAPTSPPTAQAPAPTSAPTQAASQPAGTLTVALVADLMSLDPIGTYLLNNGRWQDNVFSPLVWRDPDLKTVSPPAGFGLATSWQYLDDKTLELKLRTGVTFHNGEPFNATAVKFTFDRLLDPANKSPQRSNYTSIDHVEVVDDSTVKLRFTDVDPVMITKLAGYGSLIVPPKFITDQGAGYFGATAAPGTGPYKVVSYGKDDRLVLEAFDGYWNTQKPRLKQVIYRIIPDEATRLAEFLSGTVDVLTLAPSQADAVKNAPGRTVVEVPVPTVSGLRLDATKPPTNNLSVRKAIAHAIDLATIIKTNLRTFGRPVGIWQSTFSFGYDDLKPYAFDVDLAKQALKDSGLALPLKVTYDIAGNSTLQKEMAATVKDMLDKVGIAADIRLNEPATFLDNYRFGKLGNIVPFAWGGWTLDFDNTYDLMYHTKESYNPSYSNPDVDRLLDEERQTLDQSKRKEVASELNKIIYDAYLDVALYQNVYVWGVNERVKNLPLPPDERLWLLPVSVTGSGG